MRGGKVQPAVRSSLPEMHRPLAAAWLPTVRIRLRYR